jgi:hypothetical protein
MAGDDVYRIAVIRGYLGEEERRAAAHITPSPPLLRVATAGNVK